MDRPECGFAKEARPLRPTASRWQLVVGAVLGWAACLAATPASAEYRITTGDTLEITALSIPTFKQESSVGIDGTVMVPLLGEVPARGLTVGELRQSLQKLLPAKAIRQRSPDGRESIAVIEPEEIGVRISKYQPVYLSGDVTKQGEHPFHPGMTVRQAIALAGGFNLLRFRMENPIIETSNLRAEYESVWASIEKERANIWRLNAVIDATRSDKTAAVPTKVDANPDPLSPQSVVAQKLAEQQFRAQMSDITREKAHLQRSLTRTQAQLASLSEQQGKEREGVNADASDYDQVRSLFERGAVITTRLTDARRAVLLSSTRALQTTVQLTQLERDKSEVARKLERVDDQQKIDALEKLQTSEANLAGLQAKLNSINDKLVYTGALRTQLLSVGRTSAFFTIVRSRGQGPASIDASEDQELQPGDVVEVAIRPDTALRGIGDGSGQQ